MDRVSICAKKLSKKQTSHQDVLAWPLHTSHTEHLKMSVRGMILYSNLHWDPALDIFEPVVAVIVGAASGGGC
jgi:hypothetical protein